jgi:Ala-tRNA(Pro) deacylase
MSIATSVQNYLLREQILYDVVAHYPTWDSAHTAQAAGVSGERLAKAIMLEDENGYLMAVIPASHKLDLEAMRSELDRKLDLSNEHTIALLFEDCAPGAIPPLASAYGVDSVVDKTLADIPDVYLEAGDHRSLIHLRCKEFQKVIADSAQRRISHHK